MKFLVALSVIACAAAAVVDESSAPIVRSQFESSPEGAFQYAYETGNGISAQAQGVPKPVQGENVGIEIQGAYRYTDPDGTVVETSYIANEAGFQPSGSHLPVGPAIPEYVLRAQDYIAAHPPPPTSPQYQPQPPKPQYG